VKGKPNGSTDSVNISEKWFELVPTDAKHHLLNSLRNLEAQQPPTPHFPLYGRWDWSVVTDFLNSKAVSSTHPPKWLLEYEFSRESKFGSQGGHAPWSELKSDAELYFSRPQECHLEPNPATIRKYGNLNLLMSDAVTTLNEMKNAGKVQDRANGWRLFNLAKTDEAAQRDALYLIASGLWRQGWGYFFSRFNKQKKRLFVPMPFSANIRQGQWFNNFLAAIQDDIRLHGQSSEFAFWGDKIGFNHLFMEMMTEAVRMHDPSHFVYIMRDFEKMDTSEGPSQKQVSFIPRLAAAYHYGKDSHPYNLMQEAMLFSNLCPIATPDGMWTGPHGEASGATVTNGGETCTNEDYDEEFQGQLRNEAKGIGYTILCSYGNGDDGMTIAYLDNLSDFDNFDKSIRTAAESAAKKAGLRIQAEKWDIHLGTYGKYCQYLPSWDRDLQRIRMRYPAALILNAICNPENQYAKADYDKDYRDLDVISKLNNGFDLEYFEALVDYVDNGMKYRLLGRSEAETSRILSKWDRYLALQPGSRAYNIQSYEWEKDPYKSPVVKYLLNKRRS
jgi:hypothetical protein